MNKKAIISHLIYFILGILVGGCILVPGMSAGTLLILFGLYGLLITHLTGFYKSKKQFFKAILFFVSIGLGILIGVFSFSKVLIYLIENYSLPTFALFAGFVTGVIPFIIVSIYKPVNDAKQKIKVASTGEESKITKPVTKVNFRWWHIIPLVITIALVIVFTLLQPSDTGIKELNTGTGIMLFVCGIISAAEMIIPGISGSFILVLMGYYTTILNAVSELNILVLLIFVAGIPFGLFIAAVSVKYFLKNFRTTSYLAIAGLLIGSVIAIFMLSSTYESGTNALGIICAVALYIIGFLCTFFLTSLEQKKNKDLLSC